MTDGKLPDPYDPDRVRARIEAVLKRRGIFARTIAERGIFARTAVEKTGFSEGSLRAFLAGTTENMQLGQVIRLADALDVTVSELVADARLPPQAHLALEAPPASLASDEEQAFEARRALMTIRRRRLCRLGRRIMDRATETDSAIAELAERLANPTPRAA